MGVFQRIKNWFEGSRGRRAEPASAAPGPALALTAPREVSNDAQGYGVAIVPAIAAPGAWYWQAVRVHHLTPEENSGSHHIYLDILDPATAPDPGSMGGRVFGARARITWDGGEQIVTIDKPLNEPGTNLPMWKWQVCDAIALGLPGEELVSDRVTGMHTGHPDEAAGNTLFHHSFSLTFLKVRNPDVVYANSVVYGVIHNAAGRTAQLLRGDTAVVTQVVAADETFRFANLGAGEYLVAVADTQLRSTPVRVNGQDQAHLDLTLVSAESVIAGRIHNGVGRILWLTRDGAQIATLPVAADESYRFAGLPAGTYRIAVAGTPVISAFITLTGMDSVTVDLTAPALGQALPHYVLFGPANQPATRAYLLLAQEYLLTFAPSFGFRPEEAVGASRVTILAGLDAVDAEVEHHLTAAGITVQRIAGSVAGVAAALAARVAAGKPF
jgi:hypothetical protein